MTTSPTSAQPKRKLYRVRVEVELYWHGSVPDSTDCDLGEAVTEELALGNGIRSFEAVRTAENLPQDVLNSCPWGEGGNAKTVKEWLEG